MMHHLRSSIVALIFTAGMAGPAAAQTQLELGKMWTFENPPLGYLKQEYGFAPTEAWLDALRLASLRFGDWCSASFVSPKGLIMTNHHCVRDNIAEISPPGADWVKNGFYAHELTDEAKIEGLTVQQLVSTRDVTAAMLAGIAVGDDDAIAETKRTANEERILTEAAATDPNLTAQVVKLHQGAAFHLYLYKVYDDIRLVCAPHLQAAHFGGDPDNFTYPRFSIDFGFCRAYENDQPADTAQHYFQWSKTGALEGDLVFVTGNPGSTGRLLTYAQMEYMRDAHYPIMLEMLRNRVAILKGFVQRIPQLEERLRTFILGDENSVKALTGYLGGLLDTGLMAHKQRFEAGFRAKVDDDAKQQEQFGAVWDRLAEVSREKTALEAKAHFHVPSYSPHLTRAVAIVAATAADTDDEERAAATEAAKTIEVFMSPIQQSLLVDHLQRAARWLGRDDPYVAVLVGTGDAETATAKLAASKLGDNALVATLLEGGAEAVAASTDPAIVAARVIVPLAKANAELGAALAAQEAVQERLVGQALFAVYGDKISPDATMTLRFSDGLVQGYSFNGTLAPYRTTFYGLLGRNAEFANQDPFHLPELWLDKKGDLDMSKAVNFVSTNDIIGGNSGSPVVDRDLKVVGLIFDGNIEQLPNRFLYRDRVERSVSVHVDAIIESMTKIYGATRVVEELTASGN